MNYKLISVALLALTLLVISNVGYGQTNQDQLAKPNQEIEVIEVNPNNFMTRTRLKKQLIKKQNEFIALYNSLASDPDFKVFCRKASTTGSHIKKRACRPAFYDKKEQQEHTRLLFQAMSGMGKKSVTFSSPRKIASMVHKERKASLQDMYQKMIADPKLKKIVEEYKELNEELADTM